MKIEKLELNENQWIEDNKSLMAAHQFCGWLEKYDPDWFHPLWMEEPRPGRTVGMMWNYALEHRPELFALWRLGVTREKT